MKFLLSLSLLSLSLAAQADEMPSWYALPNKGKNCVHRHTYQVGATTCGVARYETWTCVTPAADAFSLAKQTEYLLVGDYGSDVSSTCSPTYRVKSVVAQKID